MKRLAGAAVLILLFASGAIGADDDALDPVYGRLPDVFMRAGGSIRFGR